MSKKRALKAGVAAKLQTRASTGLCYRPECKEPLIREVGGHPIVNFQFAHIRDELPPKDTEASIGWRYWPAEDMSQSQRNLPDNIILLCTVCHKLIDKIDPRPYTVELLNGWKNAAEREGSLSALGMKNISDNKFLDEFVRVFKLHSNATTRSAAELLTVSMDPGVRPTSKPTNFENPSQKPNSFSAKTLEESWPPVEGYKQMAIRIIVTNNSDEPLSDLNIKLEWNMPTYKVGCGAPPGEEGYRVIETYFYQGKGEKSEIVEKNVHWASCRYSDANIKCGTVNAKETKVIRLYRVTDRLLLKSPSISYSFTDIDLQKWNRTVEGKLLNLGKLE